MESKQIIQEYSAIIIASFILGLAFSYPNRNWQIFLTSFLILLIIVLVNIGAKKFFAYSLETDVNFKFWSMYWYGLTQKSHYDKPIPMAWLPLISSLFTFGYFIWMPILEFDVSPRPERIARHHGMYRYAAVTEWHIALIAMAGIFTNIILGILGYLIGFETFAKWSIFYAAWSIFPLGRLDGAKIFFGSRKLWFTLLVILALTLLWGLTII